jgi:hypothetical protein
MVIKFPLVKATFAKGGFLNKNVIVKETYNDN